MWKVCILLYTMLKRYHVITHNFKCVKERMNLCHPPSSPKMNEWACSVNVNCWKIFHSLCHYLFINTILGISLFFVYVCFFPQVRAAYLQVVCIFIRTYAPYNKHNRQFIDFIGNIAIEKDRAEKKSVFLGIFMVQHWTHIKNIYLDLKCFHNCSVYIFLEGGVGGFIAYRYRQRQRFKTKTLSSQPFNGQTFDDEMKEEKRQTLNRNEANILCPAIKTLHIE